MNLVGGEFDHWRWLGRASHFSVWANFLVYALYPQKRAIERVKKFCRLFAPVGIRHLDRIKILPRDPLWRGKADLQVSRPQRLRHDFGRHFGRTSRQGQQQQGPQAFAHAFSMSGESDGEVIGGK